MQDCKFLVLGIKIYSWTFKYIHVVYILSSKHHTHTVTIFNVPIDTTIVIQLLYIYYVPTCLQRKGAQQEAVNCGIIDGHS